jgi:hypothetical protein
MPIHQYSGGGDLTVAVTQAQIQAGNVVVRSGQSRLVKILVTTAATAVAALTIFDNATTASGTIIGVVPIGTAVGTLLVFDMPASNGIVVGQQAGFTGGPLTISVY